MHATFETSSGRARLAALAEVRTLPAWREGFARLAKDHRYYELLDAELSRQFEFHYLVLEDRAGNVRGVQPIFVVEQDLVATAPAWIRGVLKRIRWLAPHLLKLRMLMVGCAAGEGQLGAAGEAEQRWIAGMVAEVLPAVARVVGVGLMIWKDFPASYRPVLEMSGFVRVPSMPATRLALNFANFDDYLARHLSHATRKNLRRKFRATRDVPIEMSVVSSVAGIADEVHALYLQVLGRSELQFERLTREFLVGLGERVPDRARFFLWRHEGRLVACSICLLHEGILYDEYLGLDYAVALEWSLYFVTLRDVIAWGMANGVREYRSTPLNYAPKRQLGFLLFPLDVHAAHTSALAHAVLRLILPLIQPTRSEPLLGSFPNAADL